VRVNEEPELALVAAHHRVTANVADHHRAMANATDPHRATANVADPQRATASGADPHPVTLAPIARDESVVVRADLQPAQVKSCRHTSLIRSI
jgi:hypothetical protein